MEMGVNGFVWKYGVEWMARFGTGWRTGDRVRRDRGIVPIVVAKVYFL